MRMCALHARSLLSPMVNRWADCIKIAYALSPTEMRGQASNALHKSHNIFVIRDYIDVTNTLLKLLYKIQRSIVWER